MTCIDVMAVPFAELLRKHNLAPPVSPVFGTAEGVAEQFPAGHFDIVMSRNALDHVRDPFKALQAMLTVTKPDGCVVVWGHVNEGEAENYRGYHQWNFCWEDGDFIIWRPGHRQSVRALLGPGVNFLSEGTDKLYRIVISRRDIG
jgi:SAM-dependent methyltransferase